MDNSISVNQSCISNVVHSERQMKRGSTKAEMEIPVPRRRNKTGMAHSLLLWIMVCVVYNRWSVVGNLCVCVCVIIETTWKYAILYSV